MKRFFFFLNIFLAIALFGAVAYNVVLKKDQNLQEFTVKKSNKKPSAAAPQVNYAVRTVKNDQESTIVKKNLFNPSRNPNAQTNSRTVNQSQMSLVGVFSIGDRKGAVILQQKQNSRQFQRFGPPGMMRPGQPYGNWNNRNFQNNQQQQAVQQYIRLGEKLQNGYELTEITRDGAVLTMNGNRIELKLQEASKNQPQAARRTRPMSVQQQMLNMQRMQMMQQMQMMRMMQQNRNQGQMNYGPGRNRNAPMQPAGNRGGTTTTTRRR